MINALSKIKEKMSWLCPSPNPYMLGSVLIKPKIKKNSCYTRITICKREYIKEKSDCSTIDFLYKYMILTIFIVILLI